MAPRKPRCEFGRATKDDTKEIDTKEIDTKEIDTKENDLKIDTKEVDHQEGDTTEGDYKESDQKEADNKVNNVNNKRSPCKEFAQRFVGHCTFCNKDFCSKHRMLEAHNCTGLDDCKKESYARNAEKLNNERTQVVRV